MCINPKVVVIFVKKIDCIVQYKPMVGNFMGEVRW